MLPDLIGTLIAALFTVMVLSFILGDNPLFRFSVHVFIGVAAGYTAAIAVRNVILPHLIFPLTAMAFGDFSQENLLALIPLLLSALLFTKVSEPLNRLGNVSIAYLVGIGAAVAIGGAVLGTLFPQTDTAIGLLDVGSIQITDPVEQLLEWVSRLIALLGTLATLIYFHFGARAGTHAPPKRNRFIEAVSNLGHGFIAVTFGVMFAGVFAAAVTALIERIQFLWSLVLSFL